MPSITSIANVFLTLSGLRKPLKWGNSVCLDSNARRIFIILNPGWYLLQVSPRGNDSVESPIGHTLTLDVAGRSEQLLLTSARATRRVVQVREKITHIIVSLEGNLDASLCLDIDLTRVSRRRAAKRMLKRMTRRFDPLQHKDSVDNIEHVQTDMLRSHGHWPSVEELYQVYHQTNQRGFTPKPYSYWLHDHLITLANHWRNTDWHGLSTNRISLQIFTMNQSDNAVWEQSITELKSMLGGRTPSIAISCLAGQETETDPLTEPHHIVLAGSGIVPGSEFLISITRVLAQNAQCELLYTDHDKLCENRERKHPVIKPGWDPYLLEAGNYIGDLCVCSSELYLKTGGLKSSMAKTAIYDFLLQARSVINRDQVVHIPGVLFSQPEPSDVSSQDRWFTQRAAELLTPPVSALRLNVLDAPPRVEILIPTRDKEPLLRQCVESILSLTDYPNYHISVIDNGSTEAATSRFHDSMQDEPRYSVLDFPGTFNYSAINNYAASQTQSDVLILLNNDTQIVQADWLTRMVQACMLPRVGCVGAKLLYDNGRVQHAGVVMGMKGVAGHAHRFQKSDAASYLHKLQWPHQVSAVTAACLAIRRDTYEQLGGLDDKELTVAFNDVDFCLRAHAAGFDNLMLSDVTITHHESLSRGKDDSPDKAARFATECKVMHQRWKQYIHRDPYWNPMLSLVEEQPMLEAAPPPVA